jgi:signal transduction histidine kinase/CheY-like chemotaxis protein
VTVSFSLTTDQLAELFPFHLLVDGELRFAALGKSLQKVYPQLQVGGEFLDHFRIERPAVQVASLQDLLTLQNTMVCVAPRQGTLSLRGQIVPVPDGAAMVGSPWLQHPDHVRDLRLSLRDFALHDPTAELLFMMQGKTAALSEAKTLAHKLRQRSEELKVAMREAQFANRAKSSFLANVSYEFRTPMTAILGYADMVFDQLQDDQLREFIDIIRQQSRHLLEIMNDVLDLSKIESGKFSVQRDVVQLFELIGELEQQFEPAFKRKGIQLRMVCHSSVPAEVYTNRVRLKQVLIGLLSNALKFTNHGSVTVAFEHGMQDGEGFLRVQVIDTGIGIDLDQESRLFSPFAQGIVNAPHRRSGTGLGLTIAKRLAIMLGGNVSYRRPDGQGSIFVLEVASSPPAGTDLVHGEASASETDTTEISPEFLRPAPSEASEHHSRERSSMASGKPPVNYPQWNCRILLVEDAVINQTLIRRLLELAGATTIVAGHGREAVDLLLGPEPLAVDLILMDMQMPIMDGCEATRQLRAAGVQLPILALTANTAVLDREACLAAGCDDFLSKPIDRFQLYKTIQTHLDRVVASRKAMATALPTFIVSPELNATNSSAASDAT